MNKKYLAQGLKKQAKIKKMALLKSYDFKAMGRLRFLFYFVIIAIFNTWLLNSVYLIQEPYGIDEDFMVLLKVLNFFLLIPLAILIEKRFVDIGFSKGNGWVSLIYLIVATFISSSLISATFSNDIETVLLYKVLSLTIGAPFIIGLLILPNSEKINDIKSTISLTKKKRNLEKEKKRLQQQKEIKKLEKEIKSLKSKNK